MSICWRAAAITSVRINMDVSANQVEITLGGNKILHGTSIDARSNEFVGVLGPNGSGKSTLLKCIYRTLKPDAGWIDLSGEPISKMSYKESAQKLAVLAQHNSYSFDFTVKDIVLMGRELYKHALQSDNAEDMRIVDEALAAVEMSDFSTRSFSTLSGGERQRVILARALAQQTDCLILDEPTNHLDIKYQLQLMDMIKTSGRTVVAAIHDLNVAAMYCDRIFLLSNGRVEMSGTPEQVITPQIIKKVFEVDAEVYKDETGTVRVIFHSNSTRA